MALTNQQYESIMMEYDRIRSRNRQLTQKRREEVESVIPEYEQLEDEVGDLSLACAGKLLEGDHGAVDELRSSLEELAERRRDLLVKSGYPQDYLEPVYDCPDCQDTGYIDGVKCHCFRAREISLLYDQSNIRKTIAQNNFSTLSFEYYEGEDLRRFQETVRISLDFVQNFTKDYQNLFFYGTVGTGKSFLSCCIANELLSKGYSVIYFSAGRLFDTLARYSFESGQREELSRFCDDLYESDLIIIDDLGTELTNSFVASELFECLNERILRRKSTIISTNLNLEELRDRYSDRIFSRITSNFIICKFSGPDIRIYKKRMRT